MPIFRVEKNNNYTVMCNYHLRDQRLSLKAVGLLSMILSLSEEWNYSTRGLASICKDGVDSVARALKELETNGYLIRRVVRDANGRIRETEYIIYEIPLSASPDAEIPYAVEADTENAAERNKDIRNTEERNKEVLNIDSFPSMAEAKMEAERCDEEEYNEIVYTLRENICYDALIHDRPHDEERIDEMLYMMADVICSSKPYIRVAGSELPKSVVRSRLLKVNDQHFNFVLDCLDDNTVRIRNIKQYLLTALYNAPVTIDNYYTAQFRHDMGQVHEDE